MMEVENCIDLKYNTLEAGEKDEATTKNLGDSFGNIKQEIEMDSLWRPSIEGNPTACEEHSLVEKQRPVSSRNDDIPPKFDPELTAPPQDKVESAAVSEADISNSPSPCFTNDPTDLSNKKPVEGILRAPSAEGNSTDIPSATVSGALSPSNVLKTQKKSKSSRKAVSFADENGGIISEQQTIDVSPSKLSRKIRRGKALPAGYDEEEDSSNMQNGVMGRVLVLLMDPPTKQYELTSVPYPLVSNEDGVVGPTQLKVILGLVATSASYEPLRKKRYKGFMRPDDIEMMDSNLTILDYKFVKDEVLVAVPEGYGVDECSRFSKPILQDKRLVRLLKKLKRYERKAEKKRRLKSLEGMKPSRHGTGLDKKSTIDDASPSQSGIFRDGILISSLRIMAILFMLLLVISILLGASQYIQEKKAHELLLLSKIASAQENDQSCGKGSFCKPFGVKRNANEHDKAFLAKLRDGIRQWKLESDDLML